ncbi:hypothetical protein AGMMS49921_01590 [Endomicrobiia bacterium]|nr:hypothetical protein AGMMS49921_01590 [Endomicrobiia bacterium]
MSPSPNFDNESEACFKFIELLLSGLNNNDKARLDLIDILTALSNDIPMCRCFIYIFSYRLYNNATARLKLIELLSCDLGKKPEVRRNLMINLSNLSTMTERLQYINSLLQQAR